MPKATTQQRYIVCGECLPPQAYTTDRIRVFLEDVDYGTLAALEARGGETENSLAKAIGRGFLGKKRQVEEARASLDMSRMRRYEFRCPRDHAVDGNRGTQFPIAILGSSGASKSHFLPAILREVGDMRALSRVGVTLGTSLYSNSKLLDDKNEIYKQQRLLDPTPSENGVLGPYGYRLTVTKRPRDPNPVDLSLLLFDVAGEDLGDIMRIAEAARFLLLSEAIIVLIDPKGFLPSAFDDGATFGRQRRIDAAVDLRAQIRVIVDTLSEAWSTPSLKLRVPFCFTIAKADAVEWPKTFEWDQQTSRVISAALSGGDVIPALESSSDEVRAALCDLGGDLVVEEIEELLDPAWTRFAAASTTSAMPLPKADRDDGGPAWMTHPEPAGVGLALLHAVQMAGHMRGNAQSAEQESG